MNEELRAKIKAISKLMVLVVLLVGVPAIIYFAAPSVMYYLENIEEFDALLVQYADKGILIFIAAQILQVLIAIIPGEVVQIAGGYVYGVLGGTFYSLIGITIGTFISFRLARFFGRDAVTIFFKEESINKVEHYFSGAKGSIIIFALFLIPGMPKDMLTYVAGLSGINEWRFYLLSMLGRMPALVGSMLMGTLLQDRNFSVLIVFAAVVCVIFVLCVIFREKLFVLLDKIKSKIKHN